MFAKLSLLGYKLDDVVEGVDECTIVLYGTDGAEIAITVSMDVFNQMKGGQ